MIRGPITFKKQMLDAKHEYEVDMERAGWPPSPPIRDAATAPTDPGATHAAPPGRRRAWTRRRPSTPNSARTRSRGR